MNWSGPDASQVQGRDNPPPFPGDFPPEIPKGPPSFRVGGFDRRGKTLKFGLDRAQDVRRRVDRVDLMMGIVATPIAIHSGMTGTR